MIKFFEYYKQLLLNNSDNIFYNYSNTFSKIKEYVYAIRKDIPKETIDYYCNTFMPQYLNNNPDSNMIRTLYYLKNILIFINNLYDFIDEFEDEILLRVKDEPDENINDPFVKKYVKSILVYFAKIVHFQQKAVPFFNNFKIDINYINSNNQLIAELDKEINDKLKNNIHIIEIMIKEKEESLNTLLEKIDSNAKLQKSRYKDGTEFELYYYLPDKKDDIEILKYTVIIKSKINIRVRNYIHNEIHKDFIPFDHYNIEFCDKNNKIIKNVHVILLKNSEKKTV